MGIKSKEMLLNGAAELGVTLDDAAVAKLFAYKDFVLEYNKKVNLTAIVSEEDFITKHFLDSLSLLPELGIGTNTKLIDIGTGAGFPGVVLKIANDALDLTLLDSLNKRITFLREVVAMLELQNVECIHARAEEVLRTRGELRQGFDYAVARAVTKLPKLVEYCMPFVKSGGEFIAMKGRNYNEELAEAAGAIKRCNGEVACVREVKLAGDEIVHSIIKIRKM